MTPALGFYAVMLALGLGWGLTIPLTRVAVSTGHHPLGLIAWQVIWMLVFLSGYLALRGLAFPLGRRFWGMFGVVAFTGTLIPNGAGFTAAAHLPAGVIAIVIAMVPMFALPVALALRLERWRPVRLGGVLLGALAVVLLVGPEASLPEGTAAVFVLVALIAPFCYGIEGNYIAWRGTSGLEPAQVLWGAHVLATALAVPIALASGVWIDPTEAFGRPEAAFLGVATIHAFAYTGYLWLVGRAGSVFAAQVAYVVTAAGVLWSMWLLGERYSGWVWLAFALMLAGVALVQPRRSAQADPEPA